MIVDDQTTPARYVVESYRQAYKRIHRREPFCRYMGNQWFDVNGELVHRTTLEGEIHRLHDLARAAGPLISAEKSVIKRLIARLRAL